MPYFILEEFDSIRLDQILIKNFPKYSRNFFQNFIKNYGVFVNNILTYKPSHIVKYGDNISFEFPVISKEIPDDVGVKMLMEQEDFFVIYKPAGLITHSDISTQQNVTLVDWLLSKYPYLSEVGPEEQRAIVHRLDKDTSGLLIIPKNNLAHEYFLNLFKNRKIKKTYLAIVEGKLEGEGIVDFPISRHPHQPHKMTHTIRSGREAYTKYMSLEYFPEKNMTLVQVEPLTGRTHQIRVHLAAIGYPIIGDIIYNKSSEYITRQALHAHKLQFWYKDKYFCIFHDMPIDMKIAL